MVHWFILSLIAELHQSFTWKCAAQGVVASDAANGGGGDGGIDSDDERCWWERRQSSIENKDNNNDNTRTTTVVVKRKDILHNAEGKQLTHKTCSNQYSTGMGMLLAQIYTWTVPGAIWSLASAFPPAFQWLKSWSLSSHPLARCFKDREDGRVECCWSARLIRTLPCSRHLPLSDTGHFRHASGFVVSEWESKADWLKGTFDFYFQRSVKVVHILAEILFLNGLR